MKRWTSLAAFMLVLFFAAAADSFSNTYCRVMTTLDNLGVLG